MLSLAQETRPDGESLPNSGAVELKPTQPNAPEGFEVAKPGIARGEVVPYFMNNPGIPKYSWRGTVGRCKIILP